MKALVRDRVIRFSARSPNSRRPARARTGMSMIEFVFFIVHCVIIFFCGKAGFAYWGWIGVLPGAATGIAAIALFYFVILPVLDTLFAGGDLAGFMVENMDTLPDCECGENLTKAKRTWEDFESGHKAILTCACARRYTDSQWGKIMKVTPDQSFHPYRKVRFWKWVPDHHAD
jgi:hypothetical protein